MYDQIFNKTTKFQNLNISQIKISILNSFKRQKINNKKHFWSALPLP